MNLSGQSSDALTDLQSPEPEHALTPRTPFVRHAVLSAAVDIAQPGQILDHLIECAQHHRGISVVGISAPYASAMSSDANLRAAFLQADLLVPDGKGFVWGAHMLGVPCGQRLAIPDLCEDLLAAGNERGWKVFIYGATQEGNAAACANVSQRFPKLSSVQGQHGYGQGLAEENAVIERLKADGVNLLIVARPSPDKELFLNRCCTQAGVVGLSAGGYADILAGKTARAPAFVQAMGMEWLYRVVQEPRRLWKRIGWANLKFAASVLSAHVMLPARRPWWSCPAIHVMAVVLALTAAYSTSLNAPYHFDDPEYIMQNPAIRSFSGLSEIKVLGFRKLWWFSNFICYRLSELYGVHDASNSQSHKPDVRIFRAWNIGCHLIAALALFGLVRRITSSLRPLTNGAASSTGAPPDLVPLAAAAIFAAHPLCTESVTYISGRDNSQGGMFYLLGLYAAAVAFQRMCQPAASAQSDEPITWPVWFWPLIGSAIFGGCAVLTKESHLTFPAAVALLYVFFFRGMPSRSVSAGLLLGTFGALAALCAGAAWRRDGSLGLSFQIILVMLALGAFLGSRNAKGFMAWRVPMNWAIATAMAGIGAASILAFPYAYQRTLGAFTGYLDSSYIRSLCSQAHAVPRMLARAVIPLNLNIDHDFPGISDPFDSRVLVGGTIILALLIFGVVGARKKWLGAFGVLLALLVIAPTNSVIERGDIVSERNFYLTAAGGACLLAWLIAIVTSWIALHISLDPELAHRPDLRLREGGLWVAALACCIAGPFASLTVLRNNEWGDGYKLWRSAWEQSPQRLRVLYNYGVMAMGRKLYDEADLAFNNAITIGELKAEQKLFRPDETVQVKCFHLAYANLAALHLKRLDGSSTSEGQKALARIDTLFANGVKRSVYDPDLAYTYAQLLFQLGRAGDAAENLQHSLLLHPWADHLYHPLGLAYLEMNELQAARQYLTQALDVQNLHTVGVSVELPPERQAEIHALLGLTKLLLKDAAGAQADFETALRYQPQAMLMVLTNSSKTRNSKLKAKEMNPPDGLEILLSQTRRDVLRTISASIAAHLKTQPGGKTFLSMLHGTVERELKRRADIQVKRAAFGFPDDPDAE